MTRLWPSHYIPPRMLHRADYLCRAAIVLGVTIEEIRTKSKARHIVRRRFAIAQVMKNRLGYSYPRIGDALGGYDHASMIHAVRQSENFATRYPEHAAMVRALEAVA